ncbi:MAG: hypothetical protein BGO98_42465 [Myxococcales bacterium 68-20]|nr:MAG: hypothetical protein BGO98_42465 [Myxococcales bacterium 68-20]
MRTLIVFASAVASVAIASACASSEDVASVGGDPPPPAVVPDGGDDDGGPVADVDVPDTRLPDCSAAGWCITGFPDEDLVFRDIAPFEEVAFAIAESATEGVKVLEWTKSTNTWKYIDDGTQNQAPIGTFAGRIYAPNVDEMYFTVGPSHIFHGQRSGGTWTWTNQALPDNIAGHTDSHGSPVENASNQPIATLGVWGTGAGDVYAYYSNTIFHRDPADGSFAAVYVADDLEAAHEHIFFSSVHGSGPNDVWFVGARDRTWTNCPLVVRKSAAGWERVADAIVSDDAWAACTERPETLFLGGSDRGGWLVDIAPVSTTEYVALHNKTYQGSLEDISATTIRVTDDGYSFEQSLVPVTVAPNAGTRTATALWRGDGETWFTSWGLVLRGGDEGTFSVSTLSRSGGPVIAPFYRIRGTSNQNLWAIGARHAYHKTTP